MTRIVAVTLIAMLLLPGMVGMAWAGSSRDAALALGAFAALGTILLGAAAVSQAAVAPAPVVVEPPAPPAVYAPPPAPPVVYGPPPAAYAPPPVVYAPPPVVYQPPVVYGPAYGYGPHGRQRYAYGYRHDWRPYWTR